MVFLILSVDYEVFGNGSGDVRTCTINPTAEILNICDKYGAKLTIFFEVCEYWAFREAYEVGKLEHLGHHPAKEMENQAIDAIKRGHDVQLHLHPQWLNWEYTYGQWQLDLSRWRISSLSLDRCVEVFRCGKETLENLIRPIDSGYRCTAFRAGGWSIQPEGKVLTAMTQTGFRADSTAAPGMGFDDGITVYDFRDCPERPLWRISNSVALEDPDGPLWEIPISTRYFRIWQRDLRAKIHRKIMKLPVCPEGCSGEVLRPSSRMSKSGVHKLGDFLSSGLMMFDISMGASEMLAFVRHALAIEPPYAFYPLVAVGHSKSFGNGYEFDRFLRSCQPWVENDLLKFTTFSEFLSTLYSTGPLR